MIVTIAKVADFGEFLKTLSTKGLDKRGTHGAEAPTYSRIPMTPVDSGCSSTGTSRTTRASSPIQRSPAIARELAWREPPVKAEPVAKLDA